MTAFWVHVLAVEDAPTTPLERVSGAGALLFIGGLALGIALLWFVPILYDTRQANRWRAEQQAEVLQRLIDEASKGGGGLTVEEVRQLVSAMDRSPRGTSGLTQSLLALLITLLVGVSLFSSLVSTAEDSSDLRKTIVTSLLAVLATIAGFFFGARTAQTSTEQATKPPEPRTVPHGNGGPRGGGGGSSAAETAGKENPERAATDEERTEEGPPQRPAEAGLSQPQSPTVRSAGTTGSSELTGPDAGSDTEGRDPAGPRG